ncbi:putative BTB/Kelch-associated [Helianthus anomalus]
MNRVYEIKEKIYHGNPSMIASDDLQVTSEYDVYLFVLKWARSQYPHIENRHKIIMNRLVKFIRYPYMTYDELREFLYTKEFERMFAVLATCEAVAFKVNARDPDYIKEVKFQRFVEREAYKYRPFKTLVQVLFHWAWCIAWVIKGLTWVIKKLPHGKANMLDDLM